VKLVCSLIALVCAAPVFAQSQGQSQTQWLCRDLQQSGGYVYPGETVVNGQACRQVSYAPAPQAGVASPSALVSSPASAVTSTPLVAMQTVTLPDSTPVKLALSQDLSSATAAQGQVVEFRVAEDVEVNGMVLVKKDTLALGKVTFAQAKKHLGRAGSLDIEADKTHAVDGSKVELHAEAGAKGKSKAGAMSAGMLLTATGVGAPIGALWLLKHGKDATIPAGSILTAYTDDEVQVRLDPTKQIADVR